MKQKKYKFEELNILRNSLTSRPRPSEVLMAMDVLGQLYGVDVLQGRAIIRIDPESSASSYKTPHDQNG